MSLNGYLRTYIPHVFEFLFLSLVSFLFKICISDYSQITCSVKLAGYSKVLGTYGFTSLYP